MYYHKIVFIAQASILGSLIIIIIIIIIIIM